MRIFVRPFTVFIAVKGLSDFPRGKGISMENVKTTKKVNVRRLVFTALMGALAIVLSEVLKFGLPFMPLFISFDFSDAPEMLAALTMGPVSGVFVCLVKNIWGCITSRSIGVGELSNFILGVALVLPAGIIAHKKEKISRAVVGVLAGSVIMALVSMVSNYFIVYPFYMLSMPEETIIGMYQAILPGVEGLWECLLVFNLPFTFVKGLIASVISLVLYKKLRPAFNSVYRNENL